MSEEKSDDLVENEEQEQDIEHDTDELQEEEQQTVGDDETETEAEAEGEQAETFDSFSFGDDESEPEQKTEHQPAPTWVKELRKRSKEVAKENKRLKEKLQTFEQSTNELAPKPKLEDFDYDVGEFENALLKWDKQKQARLQKQQQEVEQKQALEQQWQERLKQYQQAKSSLNVPDFDDAEDTAKALLDDSQQSILIHAAKNPERLVYALGKNPERAKALGEIKDPVKYTYALAQLEKDLKMNTRKKAPPAPERRISGTGSSAGANAQIEKLREEASRTGDFSKLLKYKKQLRKK